MNRVDFDAIVLEQQQPPRHGRKLICLRRYTLAICLVEALAIATLLFILFRSPQFPWSANFKSSSQVDIRNGFQYKTYTNGVNTIALVPDAAKFCSQAKHDIDLAVRCHSKQIKNCKRIDEKEDISTIVVSQKKLAATIITTSKAGDRLESQQALLEPVECGPVNNCAFKTQIQVNPNLKHQSIIGWGGALTDSSIQVILSLTTNGTKRLVSDYFGQDGLRFNMVRLTIGGSDFSPRFYTNDDSTEDDLELRGFALAEEDRLYKIPMVKYIANEHFLLRKNDFKLLASMWSPPMWMKTNNHFNKGQLKGTISSEPVDLSKPPKEELYFNALAELKRRFLLAYKSHSIDFWALTIMNEPFFARQPFLDFNTMIFPRDDYGNYVEKYLGPKLSMDPNLAHVKLIAHDDNRKYLLNQTIPLMDKPNFKRYISGIATHSYVDEEYDLMNQVYARYNDVQFKSDKQKEFFVLPTELSSGHLPFMLKALPGNWNRGVHYALDMIRSLQNSAAGWVDWNMVLDTSGGPGWLGGRLDAPVIVDKQADVYYKSPMYYVLGHFSRYIKPGSRRVHSVTLNDHYDSYFESVTFELPSDATNDHMNHSVRQATRSRKLVTVILNNNPYPIVVHLRLSAAPNASELVYGLLCGADSIQTVIYNAEM